MKYVIVEIESGIMEDIKENFKVPVQRLMESYSVNSIVSLPRERKFPYTGQLVDTYSILDDLCISKSNFAFSNVLRISDTNGQITFLGDILPE